MKGYKMLNDDMTSQHGNMKYEVGKTYKLDGEIIPCHNGYHFCEELTQCYYYYSNIDCNNSNCNMRFFEIESGENVIKYCDKYVTDEITLVKELSLEEVFEYIRENEDKVDWYCISSYQELTEDFIIEFADMVDWDSISSYQVLTEDFIRKFEDKVNWKKISRFQDLTENFIKEFKDRL